MKIKSAIAVAMLLALTAYAQDGAVKSKKPATKVTKAEAAKPPTKLVTIDTKKGTGKEAKTGKTITVHYTGWLWEAGVSDYSKHTPFDSSVSRDEPFRFNLGEGRVIKGWEKGFEGMKVGGKRRLIIPPDMGYGPSGTPGGPIPPNATLVFDVELLDVKDPE